VRREADDDLAPGGPGEFLVELGHVTVMPDTIGMEAFRHLREQHFLFRPLPAPVMPDLASITMASGSIAFALRSGMTGSSAQVV